MLDRSIERWQGDARHMKQQGAEVIEVEVEERRRQVVGRWGKALVAAASAPVGVGWRSFVFTALVRIRAAVIAAGIDRLCRRAA